MILQSVSLMAFIVGSVCAYRRLLLNFNGFEIIFLIIFCNVCVESKKTKCFSFAKNNEWEQLITWRVLALNNKYKF